MSLNLAPAFTVKRNGQWVVIIGEQGKPSKIVYASSRKPEAETVRNLANAMPHVALALYRGE